MLKGKCSSREHSKIVTCSHANVVLISLPFHYHPGMVMSGYQVNIYFSTLSIELTCLTMLAVLWSWSAMGVNLTGMRSCWHTNVRLCQTSDVRLQGWHVYLDLQRLSTHWTEGFHVLQKKQQVGRVCYMDMYVGLVGEMKWNLQD